jgi:acetolactate synthase-1/2/3 large subunit
MREVISLLASKLIMKCLEDEGVEVIFGYPGGAVLPIYNALRKSDIRHILVRNEQNAGHYASGYSRETGKVGVCMATSGPGATNLVTSIATAYMDSIPLVAITGQVNTNLIGTDAFQEADITGATEPFTKYNYLVQDAKDIPRIIKEAFYLANSGRKGPVLIDIPRNVQEENIKPPYNKKQLLGYNPTYKGHKGQIKRAINQLKKAKNPLIYAGGGIISSNAQEELYAFAEKNNLPVITSLMGIGSFPQDSSLYAGLIGSHGYPYSNYIVSEVDLLIAVGARISDRATANLQNLNPDMRFIHIDIDPAEIGKNMDVTLPIVGDAKEILKELIDKDTELDTANWLKKIEDIKEEHPVNYETSFDRVNPKKAFRTLSELADNNALISADVGLNQIWAALYFEIRDKRNYITSGGLGTMGYSLPAGLGVKVANSERQVFVVCGDGSFQMSMCELATLKAQNLDVKILLFNNGKLGMVRNLQYYAYGKGQYSGVNIDYDVDFLQLAKAYDIPGFSASTDEEFNQVIKEAIAVDGPAIVEIMVHPDMLFI